MNDARQFALDLIRQMADAAETDLSGLARKAGIAPSTLTRFVNSTDPKHLPTTRTLFKLAKASGIPMLHPATPSDRMSKAQAVAATARAVGIGVAEAAALLDGNARGRLDDWIRAIQALPPGAETAALRSIQQFGAGHLALEQSAEPIPGKRIRRSRR